MTSSIMSPQKNYINTIFTIQAPYDWKLTGLFLRDGSLMAACEQYNNNKNSYYTRPHLNAR